LPGSTPLPGTEVSNPPSSSGESSANLAIRQSVRRSGPVSDPGFHSCDFADGPVLDRVRRFSALARLWEEGVWRIRLAAIPDNSAASMRRNLRGVSVYGRRADRSPHPKRSCANASSRRIFRPRRHVPARPAGPVGQASSDLNRGVWGWPPNLRNRTHAMAPATTSDYIGPLETRSG
jgi:hypothetical protein